MISGIVTLIPKSGTSTRPIADGRITVFAALMMLAVLGVAGLAVLIQLQPKPSSPDAALPLIVIYPLAKRFTGFPQIVLGLTFAWGVLLGRPHSISGQICALYALFSNGIMDIWL